MTFIQSLRLLRPTVRASQVACRAQFHVGQSSGRSSRLQQDGAWRERDSIANQTDENARISEFQKMRLEALEEVGARDLYNETHPRLVHRRKPMSVPTFRKVWKDANLDDPSNTEIVTLYGTLNEYKSPRTGRPSSLTNNGALLTGPQAASSPFVCTGKSSSSSPLPMSSRRSRA